MDTEELKVIKTALLSEVEGEKYYRDAASKAHDPEASQSFLYLADDEHKHQMMLRSCIIELMQGRSISAADLSSGYIPSPHIFTGENAPREFSGMDISVYHIAIMMEKASIDYYRNAALSAKSESAKSLYEFLVNWEIGHLDAMEKIYDRLTEEWWDQQHFSPA